MERIAAARDVFRMLFVLSCRVAFLGVLCEND